MADKPLNPGELRVIVPSLGKRYSGINASITAVLPEQVNYVPIAAVGFNIPDGLPRISFGQLLRHCRRGRWRIWHARRNIDMLAGIVLRYLFRFKFILLFTSVAQRHHSWLTRFYYHRMDGLIAATDTAASFLDRRAVIVSHGVNTEKFSLPADRARAWEKRGLAGRYGIGILGRIRPQKGVGEFVDAMLRVLPQRPDWTAVIIGRATEEFLPFEQRLRAKIKDAGLEDRIHFTGYLNDPEDIPGWYRSLSVVVCASRSEGFGLTCLEAMASGCPVVATTAGAWPRIVSSGEDGYIVPCEDTDALSDAIMKITQDPERVHEMGMLAHEKMNRHYRIQDEAAGIQKVYDDLFRKFEQ